MSNEIRPVARIITRMTEEGDGLFIGITLKGGSDFFEPNSVYELREIMGEASIVKVGETNVNWYWAVGDLLDIKGKYAFLTKEEYEAEIRRENDKPKD